MLLRVKETGAPPIEAGYIGSVQDVMAGHLSSAIQQERYSAANFQYGFELASPQSIESMGEAVIVNGLCYANSTDRTSREYFSTIVGPEFVTTGLFLIPKEAKPAFLLEQSFETPITLYDLYEGLFKLVSRPFAITGFFGFKALRVNAIAKPPIYEEEIFDHRTTYYPYEPKVLRNVSAFLVGVVADYGSEIPEPLLQKLKVVLYKNPFEGEHKLANHAHGIVLDSKVQQEIDITPGVVKQVWHVFPGESSLMWSKVKIFTVGGLTDFT